MQLPGGLLAEKYGGKYTLLFGILTSTICTLATPVIARAGGAIGLIILRFILGLGQVSYFTYLILPSRLA